MGKRENESQRGLDVDFATLMREAFGAQAAADWVKQFTQTQELMRDALGVQAAADWVKQFTQTQELMRDALGVQAAADWVKQFTQTQELMRDALGVQAAADWVKQFTQTQELMRDALGVQAAADWVKQFTQTQELMRDALGGHGAADWIKQFTATQDLVRQSLGSPAAAEWIRQFAKARSGPAIPPTAIPALGYLEGRDAPPVPPKPERARPRPDMLRTKASEPWISSRDADRVRSLINQRRATEVLVLAADVRKSSLVMKEALDLFEFASALGDFVEAAEKEIKRTGIFDKFTGDGFLAYWPITSQTRLARRRAAIRAVKRSLDVFTRDFLPRIRRNSQFLPSDVGLAVGIDEGRAQFVQIAGELTIVGPPVVGAVRMASAALAGETIINVHTGESWRDEVRGGKLSGISLVEAQRTGKEYPTQEVFALTFAPSTRAES